MALILSWRMAIVGLAPLFAVLLSSYVHTLLLDKNEAGTGTP